MAASSSPSQIKLLTQKRIVLQCKSSLPTWKVRLGLIHFGLVVQRKN